MDLSPYLEAAKRAALLGGAVLKEHFGKIKRKDVGQKALNDFVTYVDKLSEETIKAFLRDRFPCSSFLAEESGSSGDGVLLWIIDPLDGTTNYIHAFPFFSVSISLMKAGEILVGVIYDPLRDDLFTALKGGGAFKNDRRIHVNPSRELGEIMLATGFPFRAREKITPYLDAFRELFLKTLGIRRAGSAALDLAYVAAGTFGGFFEIGLSTWDIAAGCLLVREAGGVITDFQGGDDYLRTGNVVAANPHIHAEILKAVKRYFPDMR